MSRPGLVLLAGTIAATCGDPASGPTGPPPDEWYSESHYRIGDAVRGDALFGIVPYLRIGPGGNVFVLEAYDNRLSVWTPSGARLFSVGRSGEGPGDFAMPYRVHFEDSRFYVRDQSKFTYFSYDGSLLETVPNPPNSIGYQGFPIRVHALTRDGSFLGRPSMGRSLELGLFGNDPVDSVPVFSIRESAAGWVRDVVYWSDIRNATFALYYGRWLTFPGQPFRVADQYQLDPGAGTVLVSQVTSEHLGAGEAELFELSAVADGARSVGDTVWSRRLTFEPIRLTAAMVEDAIDQMMDGLVPPEDESGNTVEVRQSARGNIEESIHVPEHLPAVKVLFTASSGQIWLLSHETVDTMNVWYSVERGDDESPPRRVLLPDWFVLQDATDTHVWGVWRDELDINYVVGRRLVRGS